MQTFNRIKKILSYSMAVLILLTCFPTNVNAVKVKENDEYRAGKTLRPISIMFHLDQILEWEKGKSPDDDLNKASVPLRQRFVGHVVNPLASDRAKIQSVPLMNSKNDEDNSVNGDEFDAFAFDFWQYVDQMIFWDGPIPTADIIDAGHRNGVPVYGTLFFNWSHSAADKEIVKKFLVKKMVGGQKTYPVADKLLEMVEYYGFDGYFINQETSMNEPWGAEMRDFMLYAQRKAKEKGGRIRFSWYDAMANDGYRNHYNAVTSGNDFFIKRYDQQGLEDANGQYASDEFFMNFNWMSWSINGTVDHMTKNHRDPFDAYAGFELQQNSYNTGISYRYLLDQEGKLKVSLGLYTPDSIRGIAQDPEDYHEQERNFWVGFDGDPTTSGDSNSKGKSWRGMARFVADKSAIMSLPFNTYFNTGHGKKWFIDGQVSKDAEWNSRGVQDILPTWRWWIRSDSDQVLRARYDFDDAYNSGNSLKFEGEISQDKTSIIKLYSTRLALDQDTKIKVAYRGGQGSRAYIGLALAEDYRDDSIKWFALGNGQDTWATTTTELSSLAGETAYALALKIEGQEDKADYNFNLGQIALYNREEAPIEVTDVRVDEALFRSSTSAEARLSWVPSDDAEYYEVYQENADQSKTIINATSSRYFYAENITRSSDMKGTSQKLYVVAVGKNGSKSQPVEVILDWNMLAGDTDELLKKNPNLCLDAKVTGFSHQNDSEPARNAINGTISSNTDKWCSAGRRDGWMSIDLGKPQTIRRVAVYHAQAGGEGANMNSRDFTIQYKDGAGDWQVAHEVRGNTKAVTDFDLASPVTAQEWKLDITHGDNSPWVAIRIYEWQMFEQAISNKTNHLPMRWVEAVNTQDDLYQVSFKNVPLNTKISIYEDKDLQNKLAEKKADTNGQTVLFEDLTLKTQDGHGKVYYTSQLDGKEESIRMALVYHKKEKKLVKISLVQEPSKKVYAYGTRFSGDGGKVELTYEDDSKQVVDLSEAMVLGFNAKKPGDQEIRIEFQKISAPETFTVTVKEPNAPKVASGVAIEVEPKKEYIKGEDLDLTGGIIQVTYDEGDQESILMTDSRVSVSGYDSSRVGIQVLTVSFMGLSMEWKVSVNPPAKVNKEKLEETIRQAELRMGEEIFLLADDDLKETLEEAVARAKVVLADDSASKDMVADAVVALSNAVTAFMEKAVKAVDLVSVPSQNKYDFGQALNLSGGELAVTYGNNRMEKMALTMDMVQGYDPNQPGIQKLVLVYKNRQAGSFEVEVAEKMAPETPALKKLKVALKRALDAKAGEGYTKATPLAQAGLDRAIQQAKDLLKHGGEDSLVDQAIRELDEAIYDLTKTADSLAPYVPKTQPESSPRGDSGPSAPNPPKQDQTIKIKEDKLPLSSGQEALVKAMTKHISDPADKLLIEKLVGKKISDQDFIRQISDKTLVEYGQDVAEVFKDEKKETWYAKEMSAIRMLNLVEGYSDGTFGGLKHVSGQEFIAFLARLGHWEVERSDRDWFGPYQKVAAKLGLLQEVDFNLEKDLNRAQVAFLTYHFLSLDKPEIRNHKGNISFMDQDKIESKYQAAIAYLAAQGVLKGYPNGNFGPEDPVTRQEVVVIIYRLLRLN